MGGLEPRATSRHSLDCLWLFVPVERKMSGKQGPETLDARQIPSAWYGVHSVGLQTAIRTKIGVEGQVVVVSLLCV